MKADRDAQQQDLQRPMTGPTHMAPNGSYHDATLPTRMGQAMRPQTAPQGFPNHMAFPPAAAQMPLQHQPDPDHPFQFAAPPMMPTMPNPYQPEHQPHRKNSLPTNGLQLIPEHSDYQNTSPMYPPVDSPPHHMNGMMQASAFSSHHLQHARPPPLY